MIFNGIWFRYDSIIQILSTSSNPMMPIKVCSQKETNVSQFKKKKLTWCIASNLLDKKP